MPLILKSLDDDGIERRIDGKTFTLGRGTDNDLVLVDPSREVSKTHCRIEADGAKFVLVDLSINGVIIDGQGAPMGPGARHTLASGDVFIVGRRRFAVTIADVIVDPAAPDSTETIGPVASLASTAPKSISHILDGASEGPESRASGGVAGEAQRWLGTLPEGSADETMRQPMGWDGPPPADDPAILPPDFDQPASDFANRSEHTPASMGAMHVPRPQQLIPTNWLDDDATASAAPAMLGAPSASTPSVSLRRAFAEGGRLDPAGLSGVDDEALMRRCGEALRAFLDGLDAIEAAQAVAERDCALPSPSEGALWADFFASNRDPLLALLAEKHPGPARVLAQRVAALADRQRALGHAVADAAHRYDGALTPAAIEAEPKSRFARGPLAKVAAWTRYVGLHAELAATAPGETLPSFLVLLRKSFARAMTKRP